MCLVFVPSFVLSFVPSLVPSSVPLFVLSCCLYCTFGPSIINLGGCCRLSVALVYFFFMTFVHCLDLPDTPVLRGVGVGEGLGAVWVSACTVPSLALALAASGGGLGAGPGWLRRRTELLFWGVGTSGCIGASRRHLAQ